MENRLIEIEKRVLKELDVDIRYGKPGHHGVFRVEILINTLRVTLRAGQEEIRSALDKLCELGLAMKTVSHEDKQELISITDEGRRVARKLGSADQRTEGN
jgi:DNA-binding MarR family transcriptional regulator